jgi:hypothetical protein
MNNRLSFSLLLNGWLGTQWLTRSRGLAQQRGRRES